MSEINCFKCKLPTKNRACRVESGTEPIFCATKNAKDVVEASKEKYLEPEILRFAAEASKQEASCYEHIPGTDLTRPTKPRIVETIEFCQRMGYKKIGLAFCTGLRHEAEIVGKIFENAGFEVVSVICKVGCIDKTFLGLAEEEKISAPKDGSHVQESMCNPICQAMILNKEKTDFNVVLGLCVGHDSMFIKYAEAMTTVLAVKDRVAAHNPLAAIYNYDSYYEYIMGLNEK